ncbi:type 4a pilus biogenesis protein PilO [Deinococcus sp.]|uniref:type 4a pilus biogenesis protein PilO n=1 Tax=Deinococcus sp. TaxID=47478 RepID=UPI0025C28ABD|nr:type 4a pilus biogenesis protein PilO [Deinococcus sp.]
MRTDLATKQAMADTYRAAVAKLPAMKTQVAQLEADRAAFVRALPDSTQFGQVVAQIRTNVAAAKADMQSLNFVPSSVANLPAGVRATDINMSVSGRFAQLFQVLRSLETQSRFTTINNVSLALPAATSLDPNIAGTYIVTVYTYDPTLAAGTLPAGAATGTVTTPAAPGAAAPAPAAPAAAGGIR